MKTDELCFFLKGRSGFAAKNPENCPAATEKEAEQDGSATQDSGQGEDTQDQSSDLGAIADVALGVVPDDVSLVVDLVDEPVRHGLRERPADNRDDGTTAPGEDGARTALCQRLGPGVLGVASLQEGVNVAQAGRCKLRGGVDKERYLSVAIAVGIEGGDRFSAGSKAHQGHGQNPPGPGIGFRPERVVRES